MITGPLKEAIRGVTTYERDLEVTGEDLKSTVILEVGAASISSRVFVNDKLCADVFIKRESGYTGNAMEHLELLIDQVRNHTCVYCYGVQNEVCMVSKNEYTFNLVDRLSKKARELDPSCFTFENQICDIFENDEAKAVFIKYLKPITEGARFDPSSPITVNALLGFVKALNIPESLLVSCEQELNKIKK